MPITGTALLVAIGLAVSYWSGRSIAHGVKKAAHAVHKHKRHHAAAPATPAEKE